MNVVDYGMQDSDWELCAGLVEFLPFDYVIVKRTGSPFWWVYSNLDPDQLPAFDSRHLIHAPDLHFPYGQEVLPD